MKLRVSDVCIALAGLAGAGTVGIFAYRTATELPAAVRRGLGHAFGVPDSAVSLTRASIELDGLHVDELAVGNLAVQHATYRPALGSLFVGRTRGTLRVDGVVLEDPPVGAFDRVTFERAEMQVSGSELRGHAHNIVATPVGDAARLTTPVSIEALGVELSRHEGTLALVRAALTGLRVGPIGGLAGAVHRLDETFEVRAAGEGAQLVAHLSSAGADVRVKLAGRELTWNAENASLLGAWGLPTGHVKASGVLTANAPHPTAGRTGHFTAELLLANAEIAIPRLALTPLTLDGTELQVNGEVAEHAFATEISVRRGEAHMDVSMHLDGGDDTEADEDRGDVLSVELKLPRTGCAELLAAVPMSLRPALDGMGVTGQLAANWKVAVPLAMPRQLTLAGDLDNQCKITAEPPLADTRALRGEGPVLLPALAPGAATPTFRALDHIPPVVVSTVLASEDGRFYQHPGVDLLQIRRALAHDLEVGAPGRGGSTITQQVAKNLFLSGERTLGRKLEEAVIAWRLEHVLNKHRILELYLNLVEMAPDVYGVTDGAKHWFHKDLAALTPDEVAELTAMLPAPKRGMDDAWRKRYEQLRTRLRTHRAAATRTGMPE